MNHDDRTSRSGNELGQNTGQLRAVSAGETRAMQRAAEMDRQSRMLWLKTFSECYDPSRIGKAAADADKAVQLFKDRFSSDVRLVEERRSDVPHRLDAGSCLLRIKTFVRDEIERRKKAPKWSDPAIMGMESLADDIDLLIQDILRPDVKVNPSRGSSVRFPFCEACQSHHHPDAPTCKKKTAYLVKPYCELCQSNHSPVCSNEPKPPVNPLNGGPLPPEPRPMTQDEIDEIPERPLGRLNPKPEPRQGGVGEYD